MELESILWMGYSLVTISSFQTLPVAINVLCVFISLVRPPAISLTVWRNSLSDKVQGVPMSMIIITSLLHKVSLYNSRWGVFAEISLPFFAYPISIIALPFTISFTEADYNAKQSAAIFLGSWISFFYIIRFYKSMRGIVTVGEWSMITCFASVVFTEAVMAKHYDDHRLFKLVSITGTIGCVIGCGVSTLMSSPFIRIPTLLASPLLTIEIAFWAYQAEVSKPACINWLICFLSEKEQYVPRFYWIIYWIVILVATIPIATASWFKTFAPRVVTRKWFHLVAVLLFTPVTLLSPELMFLSYTIAICALLVIENVRNDMQTSFQDFYLSYLDYEKDKVDQVIISHVALIGGCAFPLWLSVCLGIESNVLRLWGVIVLGVGDSCAAIVGKLLGTRIWGRNRSLEGSSAMLMSIIVCCCKSKEPWEVAAVLSTLIEAFTSQIDNIVLPIAGVLFLLKTP
mmetsp:Transcript_10747/g.16486  ORF Transcript_10747/g.16486 Transcript_10747/m.16486 type:complete len:457 (-) Transcript_10747:1845-3215(-)